MGVIAVACHPKCEEPPVRQIEDPPPPLDVDAAKEAIARAKADAQRRK